MAVLYNQCFLDCANSTIIAYQDVSGFMRIGVHTLAGWVVQQLDLNNINNTGLALTHWPDADWDVNRTQLYYQSSDLNLSMISWPTGIFGKDGKHIIDVTL